MRTAEGSQSDFLRGCDPRLRRQLGVYLTPPEVVHAQVALVDDVLRHRLFIENGFADPRVIIIDPAAGAGAYPLAILDSAPEASRSAIASRMRLFEVLPAASAMARAHGLSVNESDALSANLRLEAPVVVCLGNPPYRRGVAPPEARDRLNGLLNTAPGIHRKNLYNDYVYFWRWAVRTVFETRDGPGVVSFLTPSSYLRGAAFSQLRRLLLDTLDELWIVDLEGDGLAARRTANVFPIRTPLAIGTGVRHARRPGGPARVHYARLAGGRDAKLAVLACMDALEDVPWQAAATTTSFTPAPLTEYGRWPSLTDLFPWQLSGAQLKRTWPIGPTPEILRARWAALLQLPPAKREQAFRLTRDRDLDSSPADLLEPGVRLTPLHTLQPGTSSLEPVPYAYRSFDRQWVLPDARLGDFMRPALWRIAGPRQIFLTSLLTNILGPGPAAVVTALVPDLDHFRGSFGARAVIPLWRDHGATQPNTDARWLLRLSDRYGFEVVPEELMAYCYALLATPSYVGRFHEELREPGPRIPLARDADVFARGVRLGHRLIQLHTYNQVVPGRAEWRAAVGSDYPSSYAYDRACETLHVGNGRVAPVSPRLWDFSVSGFYVVRSWLRRRIRPSGGKSPLDTIQPQAWTAALSAELLELLWVLEATLDLELDLAALLDDAVANAES